MARYGVGSVEPRAEGALVKLVSGSVLEDYAAQRTASCRIHFLKMNFDWYTGRVT